MAIAARNQRMALIGMGSPVPRVLPHPDGSIDNVNDRFVLVFLYQTFGQASSRNKMSLKIYSTVFRPRNRIGNLSLKKVP